jgi:hypothetical protein
MASQVDVINRALTKIGEYPVVDVTDSAASQAMSAMWNVLRDSEMRNNRWGFAIARAQVAADATAPAFGYTTRFPLPTNCLRILMAGTILPGYDPTDYRNAPDSAEWAIEGRYLLCNEDGPLNLRYISRVEDVSVWDASFVEVFACKLAWEACERVTQSAQKRQLAEAEYRAALTAARRAGAIELPPEPVADDSWIMARVR